MQNRKKRLWKVPCACYTGERAPQQRSKCQDLVNSPKLICR